MIPKKIHFCWFGGKDYSPLVEKCIESWRNILPDWEIMIWNEENSPVDHPFVEKALRYKKYAFASDYVRFYALNKFGGIYLDTDVEVIKDMSALLNNSFFCGYEDHEGKFIGTAVLGSISKHEYLDAILKYYDNLNEFQTSPYVITNVLQKINISNVEIYQYEYFYPYNPYDVNQKIKQLFYSDIKKNTYTIHHWNFSWKPSLFERIITYIKNKN